MRVYRERLGVPAWWWPAAAIMILSIGSMLWIGWSLIVAAIVYAVFGAVAAAALTAWSLTTIEVTPTELRAGAARLPLADVGDVTALDVEQTRELRGAQADPRAYLLARPYLPRSVFVEVAGHSPGWPYWLIGTRRPDALATAVRSARSHAEGAVQ